ncbi:hypothetical protein F441_20942, partial [Phytophthora nicotianae CJ01A1]
MVTAFNSSGQTTQARTIMTLDGYVSRGQAPPNSVTRDYALLQDFTSYLELRLKCVNMSMLRRVFADFLNDHEKTLVPMMQQGCTIITIYPVLRTSAQRRQKAEALLAKPKYPLETRNCVFLYLHWRTATRNMMLLKHLLVEFMLHCEKTLLEFVERGCQVISVIPFELPQMVPLEQPSPSPALQDSPRSVDATTAQQHAESEAVESTSSASPSAISGSGDVAAPLIVQKKSRGKQRKRKTGKTALQAAALTAMKLMESSLTDSEKPQKRKQGRKRKCERKTSERIEEKPKRGKPGLSEAEYRSQVELSKKMEDFEAQIPWGTVYINVPPPFDKAKHPVLALKFRKFWLNHSRAVWERKFWVPISRKFDLAAYSKRNNRQLLAKNAFESLIICAYEELGAEFFVKLDSQKPRHPGWWYRDPVVALFALQQMKGEDAMWEYVMNQELKRFPVCKVPLPLTASNMEGMRKRESASVWIDNPRTERILYEIAILKAENEAGMVKDDGELESAGTNSMEGLRGGAKIEVSICGHTKKMSAESGSASQPVLEPLTMHQTRLP